MSGNSKLFDADFSGKGPADTVTQAETSTHSTTEVAASSMEITPAVAAEVKPQPGAGGGGGKKKKKGKK